MSKVHDWVPDALERRARGETYDVIASVHGVSPTTVRTAVNPEKKRKSRAKSAECKRIRSAAQRGEGPIVGSFIFKHKPRAIRKVIDRPAVMPAARLFAAGRITRQELIASITP